MSCAEKRSCEPKAGYLLLSEPVSYMQQTVEGHVEILKLPDSR